MRTHAAVGFPPPLGKELGNRGAFRESSTTLVGTILRAARRRHQGVFCARSKYQRPSRVFWQKLLGSHPKKLPRLHPHIASQMCPGDPTRPKRFWLRGFLKSLTPPKWPPRTSPKQTVLLSSTNASVFCGPFRPTRMRTVGRNLKYSY